MGWVEVTQLWLSGGLASLYNEHGSQLEAFLAYKLCSSAFVWMSIF